MKMAKNSWRLAFILVGVQVAIMAIVIVVFSVVAPNTGSLPVVVVSVCLATIANILLQKNLSA